MIGPSPRLPDPRDKPWLTVAELAAITGEGEKAIRAALDAGQLPALRIARYIRIPTAALLDRLGIAQKDSEAAPASAATALDTDPRQEPRHEHHAPTIPKIANIAHERLTRAAHPAPDGRTHSDARGDTDAAHPPSA